MQFSYNWLQSFFNKKLPAPDKLAEILTLRAFEVEGIEKKKSDYLLDIDILPNRAHDCFGYYGVAQEISAILNYKIKIEKPKPQKSKSTKNNLTVSIEDEKLCKRYLGVVMDGIRVGQSPKWLKDRLLSIGQKPINNIVDATNYIMLVFGQPLHAFDADKVSGGITVRMASDGEKITTLDNQKIGLDKNVLLISDDDGPLAVAGIKGGKKAEITKKTKKIILESANFQAINIRNTAKRIGIITDSSQRFAANLDPNLASEAMLHIISLIKEIAGGELEGKMVDVYPKKIQPISILFRLKKASSVLGVDIPQKKILDIFKSINCLVKKNKNGFIVTPPTKRLDLTIEEDLIEEVGRIYGYSNIDREPLLASLSLPEDNQAVYYRTKTQNILSGLGFFEVYNYSFVGDKELELLSVKNKKDVYRLLNPTKPEFQFMRPALSPSLISSIKHNLKYEKALRLFEIDKVYYKNREREHLACALAFDSTKISNKDIFLELKGFVSSLLESLGVSDLWFDDVPSSPKDYGIQAALLHPFQRAEVKVGNTTLGVIGSIHPEVLGEYKLKGGVALCELDFENMLDVVSGENEYRPISKYPALVRDLALLVPKLTRTVDVLNIIEITGGKILVDTDLFDVYEGGELPEDKKNFAFHLIFQSDVKTLQDEEVDDIMERIIKALEKNLEWEVRK